MKDSEEELVEKLKDDHCLTLDEYESLIEKRDEEASALLKKYANEERESVFGKDVYIRGLIEFSNICKNDCFYCGIRRSNKNIERYRLSKDDILLCCSEGYELGFRTFVLQSGEDPYFTDDVLCDIIEAIKTEHPDCAITLSLGERSLESYKRLFDAGADRYLLRHETADEEHYKKLHPEEMSFSHRMNCLYELKEIGYQTGCGFMVGSPFQTNATLAKDLKFIEEFRPHMCGIGPFIPHHDTIYAKEEPGTLELTCFLLSVLRLIHPEMNIPATTALSTINETGREEGLLAGANVIMPNLSPTEVRKYYALYDNKRCTGEESAQCRFCIETRVESAGFHIAVSRGDYIGAGSAPAV